MSPVTEEMAKMCASSRSIVVATLLKTPIGNYTIETCNSGLHSVHRDKRNSFEVDLSVSIIESNPGVLNKSNAMMDKVIQWFNCYFHQPLSLESMFPKSIPICVPNATEFQMKVWETLQRSVQLGSTISYMELANLSEHPKAARAVGSAMKNNPNAIIVPCHRVLKSNSDVGNYNGGSEIKVWLLNHEKTTGAAAAP